MTAAAGALGPGEFRSASATGEDWHSTVYACLDGLGAIDGANLGFLYLTDALAGEAEGVLDLLKRRTGIDAWIGTTGIGICADDVELFDQPALAVMVGWLPEGGFRLLPRLNGGAANSGLDRASGEWIAANHPPLGVVHADPRNPRTPDTIAALAQESGAFLVGGLTSSRGPYRQICGTVGEGGVSGVLFGEAVAVMTGLSQGCSPIGPLRTITAAHDNIIETIDDRPALEVFKEDIGELLSRDLRRVAGYVFAALPVAGSDTGDYLVRNLVGIDRGQGWLAIGELIEPGQPILFTRRDRDSAARDLDRMLTGLKRRLGNRPARGAVYVSCVARGPNLFGPNSEELRQVRESIGPVPLVGFFANGEISHDRLYGYTGVLTLFL